MKLIDILVEELPKRGGWPADSDEMCQSQFDCEICTRSELLPDFYVNERAEDNCIDNGITREQYEAALAAKNEGWIEWSGGEFPVEESVLVDVKFRDGSIHKAQRANYYEWGHGRPHFATTSCDIIAYRLHQPQEAEQAEADDETDLNECIGQDAAPVWNGEGLPPAGCECEYTKESLPGDEWTQCTVDYVGSSFVVYRDCYGVELTGIIGDIKFRPIRSEADEKRDDRASAIDGFISGFRGQKTGSNKELAYALTDYLALLDKL